jgi:hypothetical protein
MSFPVSLTSRRILLIAMLALGAAFALYDPLLAPWVNDEPRLIGNAMVYNAQGVWAPYGLRGTFRVRYGPLPTWLYQVLLSATHDIGLILLSHAGLFYGATIAGLLWLGRELRLRSGFVAAIAVSPAICFYSRLMWDNSFLIPLSVAMLALYARSILRPSAWLSAGVAAAGLVACTIHLMALPLVMAVALHAALRRAWTLQQVATALCGAVLVSVPFWPYVAGEARALFADLPPGPSPVARPAFGAVPSSPVVDDGRLTTIGAVGFVFTGARVLAGDASNLPRFESGGLGAAQTVAAGVSWLVHGLFAVGVVTSARRWFFRLHASRRVLRSPLSRVPEGGAGRGPLGAAESVDALPRSRPFPEVPGEGAGRPTTSAAPRPENLPARKPPSPADELALVAMLTIALLMLMFVASHPLAGPHYFNGVYAAYVLLAWVGLGRLDRRAGVLSTNNREESLASGTPALRLFRPATLGALTAALAVSTLLCLINLRQTGGRQTGFGPTVASQRQALHELAGFGSRNCVTDVVHWQAFPFGPVALAALDGRDFGTKPRAAVPPAVLAESEKNGRLRVTNAPPSDFVRPRRRPLRLIDLGGPLTLQP